MNETNDKKEEMTRIILESFDKLNKEFDSIFKDVFKEKKDADRH